MSDISIIPEGATPVTVGEVLGKKPDAIAVAVPIPTFSPWAYRFKTMLREKQVELVKAFDPKGAEPGHLARVKEAILAKIASLPESVNAVEIVAEGAYSAAAEQTMVIVFSHEL